MGLLRIPYGITVLTAAFFLASGCGGLQLSQHLTPAETDWRMSGGNIGRTNTAPESIDPPLSVVWKDDAGAGFGFSPGISTDNVLFAGNLHGDVHAIRIQDGKDLGSKRFGSALMGTPAAGADTLFLALAHDDPSLLAYNVYTGAVLWKAAVGDVETSPLILDRHIFVTTLTGKLQCIATANGSIEWTYALPERSRSLLIHSSPVSDGNLIVFGTDNSELCAVNSLTGHLEWKTSARAAIFATPSINLGKVFVGSLDSMMYAFEVTTGKVVWSTSLGSKIYGGQAVDNQSVYVGTVGGTFYCLNAVTGAVVWRSPLGGVLNSAPLLSGSVVYVGSLDKNLYALDRATGSILWKYTAEGRIKSAPIIADSTLIIFAEDRSVIALRHEVTP